MKYCGSLHVTPLIRFYVDVKYILLHNSHLPCHRDILIQCQVIYVNLMMAQEITTGKTILIFTFNQVTNLISLKSIFTR